MYLLHLFNADFSRSIATIGIQPTPEDLTPPADYFSRKQQAELVKYSMELEDRLPSDISAYDVVEAVHAQLWAVTDEDNNLLATGAGVTVAPSALEDLYMDIRSRGIQTTKIGSEDEDDSDFLTELAEILLQEEDADDEIEDEDDDDDLVYFRNADLSWDDLEDDDEDDETAAAYTAAANEVDEDEEEIAGLWPDFLNIDDLEAEPVESLEEVIPEYTEDEFAMALENLIIIKRKLKLLDVYLKELRIQVEITNSMQDKVAKLQAEVYEELGIEVVDNNIDLNTTNLPKWSSIVTDYIAQSLIGVI